MVKRHFKTQSVHTWRREFCHTTFKEEYSAFAERNVYAKELTEFFGEVFYNPDTVDGKALYGLLDYTHNVNR